MSLAAQLPECLGRNFNCTSSIPDCQNSAGFVFINLWNITKQYWEQCPNGSFLFKQSGLIGDVPSQEASLTNAACEFIAGADWEGYPSSDIWPPLGFWEESFSIVHLLGDPIGSSTDLIRKIDSCQTRAEFWKDELNDARVELIRGTQEGSHEHYQQRLWKALALISVSYDEWGSEKGDIVGEYIRSELNALCSPTALGDDQKRKLFVRLCLDTANLLAADRATKFLPVIVAQAFFISSVIIAIVRTIGLAQGPNPQTYIDIETYSIGFTALYFWVISTITLTSVIGTSQTANAVPNILAGFRQNLIDHGFSQEETDLPENLDAEERYRRGGIYSWQSDGAPKDVFKNTNTRIQRLPNPIDPQRRRRSSVKVRLHQSWPWLCTILPLLNVSFGTIIGMKLTALVPPDGWSCRSIGELTIFAVWLISYPFTLIPMGNHHRSRFWFTFIKDFVAMGGTLGIIIATQIGIYNKCSCYTNWGTTGLALPETPILTTLLQNRLKLQYPILTVAGIFAQLVIFPGIILWKYYGAVRVFLQRDDGANGLQWFYNIFSRTWWMEQMTALEKSPKQKYSAYPVEEGRELGVTIHATEATATLLDHGQDEAHKTKGDASHVEEAVAEDYPVEPLRLPEDVFRRL